MPVRKLTDGQVSELRARASGGVSASELASTFGVTRRHVERLLSGEQRAVLESPGGGPVLEAVERFLDSLRLDREGEVRAATARTLAGKIDAASVSGAVGAAQALPGLARALDDALRGLDVPREMSQIDLLRARRDARRAAMLAANSGAGA